MKWTVDPRAPHSCGGSLGCLIPAGEPFAIVWQSPTHAWRVLRRCAAHAGAPVNHEEVENERWRLEQEATRPRTVLPPVPPESVPGRPVKRWTSTADMVDKRLPRGDRE